MTPADITAARAKLGRMRGLGRPMFRTELARELRLSHAKGDDAIRKWEQGKVAITGPASLALEALLSGFVPVGENYVQYADDPMAYDDNHGPKDF